MSFLIPSIEPQTYLKKQKKTFVLSLQCQLVVWGLVCYFRSVSPKLVSLLLCRSGQLRVLFLSVPVCSWLTPYSLWSRGSQLAPAQPGLVASNSWRPEHSWPRTYYRLYRDTLEINTINILVTDKRLGIDSIQP